MMIAIVALLVLIAILLAAQVLLLAAVFVVRGRDTSGSSASHPQDSIFAHERAER